MRKQTNIFNRLKANLKVLLPVCLALVVCSGAAYADGAVLDLSRTPTGTSQVFRQQTDGSASSGGSSALSSETRRLKRAIANTITGEGPGVLAYTKSVVGDMVNSGLDAVDQGMSKAFSSIESALPDGFIKDVLVTYNPTYQVAKFATKAAVKVAKVANNIIFGASNRECNRERMDAIYKSGCYACDVVSALIGSFMTACTYLYDVSKDAGVKLLALGIMLWIAFYVLQQLSSLKNLEPAAMVNDMLKMAFKVLGAYLVINAGIDFFINYAVVPFMSFGAEFGMAMLTAASTASGLDLSSIQLDSAYNFPDGIVPSYFLNQLQQYVAATDYSVSTHLEIGHMLTCHATHAGAYDWKIARIPNLWTWFAGAVIWFFGFMLTLAVTYYLVDVSFKLGFAIIALPIMVGLWPFNITKNQLAACFSIILKAAGVLIFLGMITAAGLALVSNALDIGSEDAMNASIDTILTTEMSGTEKLMTAIEDGDNQYIDDRLSFWSFGWIVILFAYLFAMKLVGAVESDYVNTFFSDKIFSTSSPMHYKLTQATDMAKSAAKKPFKAVGKAAKAKINNGLDKVVTNVFKSDNDNKEDEGLLDKAQKVDKAIDKINEGDLTNIDQKEKKTSMAENAKSMTNLDPNKDKQAREKGSGQGGAGDGMEKAGKAMKDAGRQMQSAADQIDQGLASADQGIKSGNQAIQSAAHAGTAASFGIAAPVTETAAAASAAATTASSASLNAGRMAAKTMKTLGKAVEKSGEAVEKAGKAVKKAEKTANKVKKAGQKVGKAVNNASRAVSGSGEGRDQSRQNDGNNNAAGPQNAEQDNNSGNRQ